MKPVINEYVRELSHPGYDAAQRNAFVAAMVSRRLMPRWQAPSATMPRALTPAPTTARLECCAAAG